MSRSLGSQGSFIPDAGDAHLAAPNIESSTIMFTVSFCRHEPKLSIAPRMLTIGLPQSGSSEA